MTRMVAVERNSWCLIGEPPERRPAGSGGKGNQTASVHHRWLLRLVGPGRALRESESPEGLRVPGAGFCSVQSAAPFSMWTGQHTWCTLPQRPGGSNGPEGGTDLAQPPAPHGARRWASPGSPRRPLSPSPRPQGCTYHSVLTAARGLGNSSFHVSKERLALWTES